MAEYLKVFKNESDYQTFREGEDWITPNVSLIETTSSGENISQINFHKYEPPKLHIYITMYDVMYDIIYEEGMTWGEWINSKYNIHPTTNITPWLIQMGQSSFIGSYDGLPLYIQARMVRLDEYIIENEKYVLSHMN